MNSIWKAIPGYENYEMSTCGKIRSLNYRNTGKVQELKICLHPKGYYKTCLIKGNKKKQFKIHLLMAMTFLDHIPNGHKSVIGHKNGIATDNRLENLGIITHRENCSQERTEKSGTPTGVHFRKSRGKYQAAIWINGKRNSLGSFSTPEEASAAYQAKLKEINGKKI